MLLRTYPLIVHPAYIEHVEAQFAGRSASDLRAVLDGVDPHLNDALDIAAYLGVSTDMLVSMLSGAKHHYREFSVTKRSGGKRIIRAPRTYLKVVQWWILDTILKDAQVHQCAFGFIKGKSFIDNASQHVGSAHVVNFDIEDFFPSITAISVRKLFSILGYSDRVSAQLSQLTTYSGTLPQGAPSSPAIANAIFLSIDNAISELSQAKGVRYTRYADDLTFSSNSKIDQAFLDEVTLLIEGGGFRLNRSKTRYMGQNDTKEVTGLIIGTDGVRLSRKYLNAARGWFHSIKMKPRTNYHTYNRVLGTRNLIAQVGGAGSPSTLKLADEALLALRSSRGENVLRFRIGEISH